MMFFLENFSLSPINWAICFLLFFLVSFLYLKYLHKKNLVFFSLIFGLAGSLSFAALVTAAGFIPDDWSACRIAVPLSLLNGGHLYSDLIQDPSNCFFYLPVGAWMYLPVAVMAKLTDSVSGCLLGGWAETLLLYFLPILLLIWRSHLLGIEKIFVFLISIILTFSTESLRYVATMIHVDVVGISLAGCAVALLLPCSNLRTPKKLHIIISGGLLGLALFTKQTFWPPISLFVLIFLILLPKPDRNYFFISFGACLIVTILLILGLEKPQLIWLYAFLSATHIPQDLSYFTAFKTFLQVNYPILIPSFFIAVFLLLKKYKFYKFSRTHWFLLFAVFISSFFAIYSFTKVGSDMNHFAFPVYFLLILIILFLLEIISPLSSMRELSWISIFLISISLPCFLLYLKTNCGAYLWIHNPHQEADAYGEKYGYDKIYFPWQPIGALLHGKFYHLDQGLKFESISHTGNRPTSNIKEFLPKENFEIAIRPFGAPSYLADFLHAKVSKETIPELPGWTIYETSIDSTNP